MTTQLIRDVMRHAQDAGIDPTEMYWFDVSGIDLQTNVDTEPLMTHRPPFARNMVVWRGATRSHKSYEVWMQVAGDDPEEGIVVAIYKGAHGAAPRSVPPMVYLVDGEMLRYGPVDEDDPVSDDERNIMLGMVALFYKHLDARCEGYVPTMRQTFTNRRKIAAGKTPTYDWTTVVIEPKASRVSERLGGTHASPRLHDRRGHLRRLRSGKNVWVRPCKVGRAELGAVFHDYEVRAA